MTRTLCAILLLHAAIERGIAEEANWPQFRGPQSSGVADHEGLPVTWSDTKNVAWRTDVSGLGWSSPIVWGNQVFLTAVIDTGISPEPRKGLYLGGEQKQPSDAEHIWNVYSYDLETGELLWEQTVHRGKPSFTRHIKNSYASATPATDGERVYAYFGNVGLFCLSVSGEPLWQVELGPYKTRLGWGTGASPVVHEGRVYLCNDNEEESYLLALDARTGDEIWRVPRDEQSTWSTPLVWNNELRTEIVAPGTNRFRSYDLEGELLWEIGGGSGTTICTPSTAHGLVYVGSGYLMDRNRPVYAIRPGASGDISLDEEQDANEHVAWAQAQAAPYNTSPLVFGDYVYVCKDQGIMACYDAHTGEVMYEKKRMPDRQFTASPWGYGEHVFCLSESGRTFVLKAGPEFEIVATNELGEDVMSLASPAMVGDRLLIRTANSLFCIQEGAQLAQVEAGGE